MSISQKFKEFIAPMDEDDVLEVEQEEDTPSISEYERPKSKVNHLPTDTKMVLFEPRSFDESEEIAKRLKENNGNQIKENHLSFQHAPGCPCIVQIRNSEKSRNYVKALIYLHGRLYAPLAQLIQQ